MRLGLGKGHTTREDNRELVVCFQVVSPKNIHTSVTVYGPNRLYLGIHMYIYMHLLKENREALHLLLTGSRAFLGLDLRSRYCVSGGFALQS